MSLVIPAYNEADSIPQLYDEICETLGKQAILWEMIVIDDGSTDSSWERIAQIVTKDARVSAVRFRRNFGKAAALSEGFSRAKGEFIVTMDADLQDDPHEVHRLLTKIHSGFDVVSGWKRKRHDPWHKVLPSRVFNWMIGKVTGLKLHDHNCGLKIYRRIAVKEISLYGELHRFITVLAHARGFRVSEIEVNHRSREYGVSKYGFRRFFNGLLDLFTVQFMTAYGNRPAHFLGLLGLVFFTLGGAGLAYLGALWLLGERPIGNRPLLLYSVAMLLLGAQTLTFGVVAELITWKLFGRSATTEATVSIATTVGSNRDVFTPARTGGRA